MKRSRRHLSLWQKLLIRAMMLALPIYIFSKPAEAEPFAYVAHNAGIGTVSVINSATNSVVASVTVPPSPANAPPLNRGRAGRETRLYHDYPELFPGARRRHQHVWGPHLTSDRAGNGTYPLLPESRSRRTENTSISRANNSTSFT